jgi:hypothetical protein
MGTLVITLCILVVFAVVGLAVWAKRHPLDYSAASADEREWMDAIK